MTNGDSQLNRIAVITELVKKAPGCFGRTALMKCLFFLKTLREVPLSYNFRLYTYGPFDSDVLDDLRYAESLGAIQSTVVAYPPGGRGYEFQLSPKADEIGAQVADFVSCHRDSIEWVVREFGSRSALDLEMLSTLVYVDRALSEKGTEVSTAELAKQVHDIKPHLTIVAIERESRNLKQRGLLKAVL